MPELVPHQHEQLALGAVILGGIAALVFGFAYLGNAIEEPLRLKPRTFELQAERESREQAELRTKDTDQDGLVDYEEIYVWNTSAYLPDTDSDGYSDAVEINSGNDPNCPRGRTCANAATGSASLEAAGSAAIAPLGGLIPPTAAAQLFGTEEGFGNLNQVLGSLPPDQIREFLIQNGVPKEKLDPLDDATLQALYLQSVEQAFEALRTRAQVEAETGATTEAGTGTETP